MHIINYYTFYQFSGANILNIQLVSKHFEIELTFPPTIKINRLTCKIRVTNNDDIFLIKIINLTRTNGNIQCENLEKITTVNDYTKNVTTKQNLKTE